MKFFKITITLFTLVLGLSGLSAQETLRSVMSIKKLANAPMPLKSSQTTLNLPFVDDFSGAGLYPDSDKWQDAHGYVNQSFGDNPPTIGVLTLDAMDSTGAIYSRANHTGFTADYLTSQPIDLDLGADTTVYLSFYFQPQGLGDAPEVKDSLVVEFYAEQLDRWVWIWSTAGSENKEFEQVLIPVRGALFLNPNFRFRFKNYASLADAYEDAMIANADNWNIDYVYLDQGRYYQDFFPDDLAILRNTGSLLLGYQAMPWEHFKLASINEVATIFPVQLRNLSNTSKFFEPEFKITDVYGTTQGYAKSLFADELASGQVLKYDVTFNYGFTSDAPDSALFKVEINLNPVDEDLIPGNSSAIYEQLFTDYYAYDDGSAENGYGITGDAATNAQIAVRFENFNPGDSLKGISIFFNRSFNDTNRKYFQLALWDEQDGQPGELIYLQNGARSAIDQGLTGFDYFAFDTAQAVPAVFYAGIQQVTADFLNIGFDHNTNHSESIFYRTEIDWKNTSFQGSLMLRPVFANSSKKSGILNLAVNKVTNQLHCFPNPTSGWLNLSLPAEIVQPHIRILNIQGSQVFESTGRTNRIDTSGWPAGQYFIILRHTNGSMTSRFIKL